MTAHTDKRTTAAVVADLLHRTRTERGLSLTIDDPATLATVAALVVGAGGDARAVA